MDKPSQRIRLLIVEDNPSDADLMLRELRRAGFDPDWRRVETEPDFLASLDPEPDLILSDYALPQFSGLRALQLVGERGLKIPFILVSATIGEETAVAAMREGAVDYLLKDRLARLGPAVAQALEQSKLRQGRERAEEASRASEQRFALFMDNCLALPGSRTTNAATFTLIKRSGTSCSEGGTGSVRATTRFGRSNSPPGIGPPTSK